MLLAQPLAVPWRPYYDKPVWHCSVRAAPGDRLLSDGEWAQVAAEIMDKTGLAPEDDYSAVWWVAVQHAPDPYRGHARPARMAAGRMSGNDFYKVRAACRSAERRLGLQRTAVLACLVPSASPRSGARHAAKPASITPPRDQLDPSKTAATPGAERFQRVSSRTDLWTSPRHVLMTNADKRQEGRSSGSKTGL